MNYGYKNSTLNPAHIRNLGEVIMLPKRARQNAPGTNDLRHYKTKEPVVDERVARVKESVRLEERIYTTRTEDEEIINVEEMDIGAEVGVMEESVVDALSTNEFDPNILDNTSQIDNYDMVSLNDRVDSVWQNGGSTIKVHEYSTEVSSIMLSSDTYSHQEYKELLARVRMVSEVPAIEKAPVLELIRSTENIAIEDPTDTNRNMYWLAQHAFKMEHLIDVLMKQVVQQKEQIDDLTRKLTEAKHETSLTHSQKYGFNATNLKRIWTIPEVDKFERIVLNDLMRNWTPKQNATRLINLKSFIRSYLQQACTIRKDIWFFAVRNNGIGGRKDDIRNLPREIISTLTDFLTEAVGYAREEADLKGEQLKQTVFYMDLGADDAEREEELAEFHKARLEWITNIRKSTKTALYDMRTYRYLADSNELIPPKKRRGVVEPGVGFKDPNTNE